MCIQKIMTSQESRQCSSCLQSNPRNAKHCIHCGDSLNTFRSHCASCGVVSPAGAKFCPQCGQSLRLVRTEDHAELILAQNTRETVIDSGEYRQVTVLFCDMVKSTDLIHEIGAENYRLVNFRYRELCAPIIEKFEGHISRFMGDGFLALFGYPNAHEDDAQRATRAALEITSVISDSSFPIDGGSPITIETRVGIATGRVVSSEENHEGIPKELTVIGETPNLASRIQELAKPNRVLVNSTTQRLVKNHIQAVSTGKHFLKGFPKSVELFELIDIKSSDNEESDIGLFGESHLIGREYELKVLHECWNNVQEGRGQIVLIRGDAGIGKSRLIREIRNSISRPHRWLEFRCSAYFTNSVLYPVLERLKQICGISDLDDKKELRKKLSSFCDPFLSFPEQLTVLADLLCSDNSAVAVHPAQRSRPLDALVALITSCAEVKPLVLVIEDLHWIDPTTEKLLARIVDQVAMTPMLVLVTARPEQQVNWLNKNYAIQLTPSYLRPSEAEELIEKLTKATPIPSNAMALLAYKTDGVPLYVEELTKAVVESLGGSHYHDSTETPLADPLSLDSNNGVSGMLIQIPETLRDSFMERLDRLGPSKNLAQIASVLGRSFTYQHIKLASDLPEEQLKQQLDQLVKSELFHQKGVPPRATYLFKHSLIQDAAYDSILTSNRRIYHERIANRFSTRFHDADRANPELVARHFVLAGKPGHSVERWSKAAKNALRRGTGIEAINHAVEGMKHIGKVPQSDRNDIELDLCITYAVALSATHGFAMPEVHDAFEKAYELCKIRESSYEKQFPVLQGLQQVYLLGGSLNTARQLGEKLLEIANEGGGALDRRAEAHRCLGWTLFCLGQFQSAQKYINVAMPLYDRAKSEELAHQVIVDAGGVGLANLGWISWFLGDTPKAVEYATQSIEHAREIDHPFTLAYTLCTAAALHQFRREPLQVAIYANEAVAIALEHGFKYWSAWGTSLSGWSHFMQSKETYDLEILRNGIKDYRETASNLLAPYIFSLLAECEIHSGQLDEALITLNESINICNSCNINFYLPETYRLKADVYYRKKQTLIAIQNCEHGLEIARSQGSSSLELRVLIFMLENSLYKDKVDVPYRRMLDLIDELADGADPHDSKHALKLQGSSDFQFDMN